MLGAEAAVPAAVLPGTLLVKAPVIAALIVAYPVAAIVDVRPVGMARLVAVVSVLIRGTLSAAIGFRLPLPGLPLDTAIRLPLLRRPLSAMIGFRSALRRWRWRRRCLVFVLGTLRKCWGGNG